MCAYHLPLVSRQRYNICLVDPAQTLFSALSHTRIMAMDRGPKRSVDDIHPQRQSRAMPHARGQGQRVSCPPALPSPKHTQSRNLTPQESPKFALRGRVFFFGVRVIGFASPGQNSVDGIPARTFGARRHSFYLRSCTFREVGAPCAFADRLFFYEKPRSIRSLPPGAIDRSTVGAHRFSA